MTVVIDAPERMPALFEIVDELTAEAGDMTSERIHAFRATGPGVALGALRLRGHVTLRGMFHVELRQFPHSARAFNLTLEELRTSFLSCWVAGRTVEWGERQWAPDRAKLTVYEGPELRPDELGMGRGWANAVRSGELVTERVLAEQDQAARGGEPLRTLKQAVVDLCAQQPLVLTDIPRLAAERWPQLRASECLELAEQAAWELLHERRVSLIGNSAGVQAPVAEEQWRGRLLSWSSWSADEPDPAALAIRALPDADAKRTK